MSKNHDQVYVIDANVFIHGSFQDLSRMYPRMLTVPEVTAELESTEAGQRFDAEQVTVMVPSDQSVAQVVDTVRDCGEDLSEADRRLVALALDQDATLVTDDYGVQNVAAAMDVSYTGFQREEIEEQISWIYRCTGCEKTFDPDGIQGNERCPVCGCALKQVPDEKDTV